MQFEDALLVDSVFETRMSRGTCQRLVVVVQVLGGSASGSDLESGILWQWLMIVSDHVSGCDAKDSAGKNFGLRMRGIDRIAWIGDDLVDSANQVEPSIDLTQ